MFKQYTALVDDATRPMPTLRGLLDFRYDEDGGIPSTRWSAWTPSSSASRPAP